MPRAQWTQVTRPLRFACRPGALEFACSGMIADTVSGVNLIAPGLVELAMYVGWFPYDLALSRLTYELELDLPDGWVLASGGLDQGSKTVGGRRIFRVTTAAPVFDVAFVASPLLTVHRAAQGGAAVEIYVVAADSLLGRTAIGDLGRALARYEQWYGPVPQGAGQVPPTRVVFSPRGGWGYSRLPLITGPGETISRRSSELLGAARNFHGMAHELAHFWWQVADADTPEDWINEGPAEYSAFTATSELYGGEARDSLLAQYRRRAALSQSTTPIAATTSTAPERYLNRYEKPTLLFAALAAEVGRDRLNEVPRQLCAEHHAHRDATTAGFIRAAREALGAQAAARLERCVTGPWSVDCGR